MSKVGHGGGGAQAHALPPTVLSEKVSTYAFGTVVAGAVMVAAAAWMGGSLATIDDRIQTGFDTMAESAGFTISNISIEGLGPRAKADVLNLLNSGPNSVQTGMNMFRADPHLIHDRLQELDHISQVRVMRQWPNEVWVLAEARTPTALWQSEGSWNVVDQFGAPMDSVNVREHAALPRVVGPKGGVAAPDLIGILRDYPEFASQVDIALRIGGRRWDLRMDSGLEIAMPEDEEFVDALDLVLKLDARTGILTGHAVRLDARDPIHFAILPANSMALASGLEEGA